MLCPLTTHIFYHSNPFLFRSIIWGLLFQGLLSFGSLKLEGEKSYTTRQKGSWSKSHLEKQQRKILADLGGQKYVEANTYRNGAVMVWVCVVTTKTHDEVSSSLWGIKTIETWSICSIHQLGLYRWLGLDKVTRERCPRLTDDGFTGVWGSGHSLVILFFCFKDKSTTAKSNLGKNLFWLVVPEG